jgi:hypothetical protein
MPSRQPAGRRRYNRFPREAFECAQGRLSFHRPVVFSAACKETLKAQSTRRKTAEYVEKDRRVRGERPERLLGEINRNHFYDLIKASPGQEKILPIHRSNLHATNTASSITADHARMTGT